MRLSALSAALLAVLALAACDAAHVSDTPESTAEVATKTRGGFASWQWEPVAGMRCRDGSATGIGRRAAPAGSPDSARVVLYLQGGGACYAPGRCNRGSFSEEDFVTWHTEEEGRRGIFADTTANPFLGWNHVFVPYCTGDIHGGDTTGVFITGIDGSLDFVGYRNMRAVLDAIADEFRDADRVALIGTSGGAFGVLNTYGLVAERLAPAPVYLINDSGPVFPDDEIVTDALQLYWRSIWNLEATAPEGCGEECFQPSGDGFEHVLPYYARTNPARAFGLISHVLDISPRYNYGYLNPNCEAGTFGGEPACLVPDSLLLQGMQSIRTQLEPYPNAGTFYMPGRAHTSLVSDEMYERGADGVMLTDWVRDLLELEPYQRGFVVPDVGEITGD